MNNVDFWASLRAIVLGYYTPTKSSAFRLMTSG